MQELFFTHGVKKELTHRLLQILNCINDIDYAVRDSHISLGNIQGEIFTATRVANRLFEEVDNAEIIG